MKRLIVLVSMVLLGGCTAVVNTNEITLAQEVCAPHGGLKYVEAYVRVHFPNAYCNNGLVVELSKE